MTVLETRGSEGSDGREPIDLVDRRKRREEWLRRKKERESGENKDDLADFELDQSDLVGISAEPVDEASQGQQKAKRRAHWQISWTTLSLLLMVVIPGSFATFYYMVIASPQYVVETQFSVRGASQSSMSTLGLSGLFGTSVQSGDSYIVASYVESLQLVRDVKEQLGIDLRQYYARGDIDFAYRIKPDKPLEEFTDYWRDMIEVSFNSTTGNITLYIYAFSADDTKAIADAVLKVSENLVNNLSEASRLQMTAVASKQVTRSEEHLKKVRDEIRMVRAQQQTLDPTMMAKIEGGLQNQLQTQLTTLQTRYNALLLSVDKNSPSARSLNKQIISLVEQLAEQKKRLGDPNVKTDKLTVGQDQTNISAVLNKFEELTVDQEFATKAYTTSLAAFETALAEAQKQERYFATFVSPTRPEIALYPLRLLDSFIALLVLLAVWMISQFLYRSFRDHAI